MKWQISSQEKEGKRSNPHHICPTEKSNLLSLINRKPSSTARLVDTTQTRTHSISCQTIIFRLRVGYCRLNSHLKRIGVKTSAQCPCGEADQTPEHYLQSCSLHQQARQQIWPTCVSLKTKLWGSAEDLFLTPKYAALTGERILSTQPSYRTQKKKKKNHHVSPPPPPSPLSHPNSSRPNSASSVELALVRQTQRDPRLLPFNFKQKAQGMFCLD